MSSNTGYFITQPIRIEYFKHVTELIHSRPISVQYYYSRDSVRKARESHLVDKAMTLEPNGLNRHDELLLFFLFQFFFGVVRHFCLSLLKTIGCFSTDDGNCSENVSFKMNTRFFQSLSRLFHFAENGRYRRISLELIS